MSTYGRRFEIGSDAARRFGAGEVVVCDGVLGAEVAAEVAAELRTSYATGLAPARMGRGAARWFDAAERGDEMAWLDADAIEPRLAPLWELFGDVMGALNRSAYLGLRRFDVQVARYPGKGERYARHADAFLPRFGVSRRATAIYYANPGWLPADGGMLRFYLDELAVNVEPVMDRLVLFASERVEHEVTPCYRERWAVTAWYYAADALL
jgi:SM-20-related protein